LSPNDIEKSSAAKLKFEIVENIDDQFTNNTYLFNNSEFKSNKNEVRFLLKKIFLIYLIYITFLI
jgi:hypothetical protein